MNIQNNTIGIWISDQKQMDSISSIIKYFNQPYDIFIVSDESITDSNYGIISSFYVTFHDGIIVFLDVENLIINIDKLRSKQIYLASNGKDLLNNTLIEKNALKNIKVIEI